MAGLFHDIGKTKLPSQILRKEKLNQAELNFLNLHPKYGLEILKLPDEVREYLNPRTRISYFMDTSKPERRY